MKDSEAVNPSAHMFSGLAQVHEDEGRSGVISVFRVAHSTVMVRQPKYCPLQQLSRRHEVEQRTLESMGTLWGRHTAIATLGPIWVASVRSPLQEWPEEWSRELSGDWISNRR